MENKKNFKKLIDQFQKAAPIHIELYPLEVIFICFALLYWLSVHPGNKAVSNIFKKLQKLLNHYFPQLRDLVAAVLVNSLGYNK